MLNIFQNVEGVKIFMSEREDGNMKLFLPETRRNRTKYLEKIGVDFKNLVAAKLVHGGRVSVVENFENPIIEDVDGLLTRNPEVVLSVTSADCLPIFLFDKEKKVAGVLHCGWRSVAKGIVENALKKMQEDFGSQSENILVGVGPGIQKCHFEVGEDLLKEFSDTEKFVEEKDGKAFLDLTGLVKEKFIENKIKPGNIEIDERCTCCDERLWSFRRDGRDEYGEIRAMMVGIKLNS